MFERLGTFNLRSLNNLKDQFNQFISPLITADIGVLQTTQVRRPDDFMVSHMEESQEVGSLICNWHRDCNDPRQQDIYLLAVWANICPTEIRHRHSHELVLVNPSEVVLFDNALYEHRRPYLTKSEMHNRYFARAYCLKKEFAV